MTPKTAVEVRREEIQKFEQELLQQKEELQKEINLLSEEVERLRIRLEILSQVSQRNQYSSSYDEFKREFYDPTLELFQEKKGLLNEKLEENAVTISQINAILEEIEERKQLLF
jgi:DNA segregation ATPase FtsK/SpoIIIE-like protein